MSYATANNLAVVELQLELPRTGNWVADLVVDATTAAQLAPGTAAAVALDGGVLNFQGTVYRAAAYGQLVILRMLGGSGGLSKTLTPKFYQSVQARTVLSDMLAEGGSSISGASNPTQLNDQLDFWQTLGTMPVSMGLSNLAIVADDACVWRVQPDGSVFFGVDAYPQSALTEYDLIDYLPQENKQVISAENPDVFPGETFASAHVSAVKHHITGKGITSTVWFDG